MPTIDTTEYARPPAAVTTANEVTAWLADTTITWADDNGRDAVEVYEWLRAPGDDEELGEAELPDYLLPICHQGCGVYVCIDCQSPEAIVFNYDPAKDTDQLTSTGKPFTEWLIDWAS